VNAKPSCDGRKLPGFGTVFPFGPSKSSAHVASHRAAA
jgi:hypothetical protein